MDVAHCAVDVLAREEFQPRGSARLDSQTAARPQAAYESLAPGTHLTISRMLSQDELWMQRALAEANAAQEAGEVPVGAVIVNDGELVAVGGLAYSLFRKSWAS